VYAVPEEFEDAVGVCSPRKDMARHSSLRQCDMGSLGTNKPQHKPLDMHHKDTLSTLGRPL
jgi:hypothetical protein